MMFMVVFKCTRSERTGSSNGGDFGPEPIDCYMVANKLFETKAKAKHYANSLPISRQARVVDVVEFRCPWSGEWQPRMTEEEKNDFTEDLIDFIIGAAERPEIESAEQMHRLIHEVRVWMNRRSP
jgi:hypothetical protein